MRYLGAMLAILCILVVGCADEGQELNSEDASRLILTEEEKAARVQKDAAVPIEMREKESAERIARYLERREDSPAAAREELKKVYHLFAQGDETFLEECVGIMERVIGAEEVLLPDLLRLNEIQLTFARQYREDAAYISRLVETDKELKEAIANLIAHGKNPNVFKVPAGEDAGNAEHLFHEPE